MGLLFCVIALLVLLFVGMPIGFSLLIATLAYVIGFSSQPVMVVCKQIIAGANSFTILALPAFLLLGNLLGRSGLTNRIVDMAKGFVGHMKGALAQVNNVTNMILACVQGVATSSTAAVGSILIPAMTDEGYSPAYSAALTAAAATVGPIIPPSITFVVLGVAAELSIGRLFMAGVIPGILMVVFLMVYVAWKARRGPEYAGKSEPFSMKKMVWGVKRGGLAMIIPVIILGGILSGIFTATEAGAFAVLAAVILALFVYRSMKIKDLWTSLKETCATLGNFGIVFAGAGAFGWMLAREGAANLLANAVLGLTSNGFVVMLLMNVIMLIAGCFMDTITNVVLFTPIFYPIALAYGYDPIHFGAIMVINLTYGTITPPLGTSMFMACGIAKVSMDKFLKEMLPMYIPLMIILVLVILIPELSTWLPSIVME